MCDAATLRLPLALLALVLGLLPCCTLLQIAPAAVSHNGRRLGAALLEAQPHSLGAEALSTSTGSINGSESSRPVLTDVEQLFRQRFLPLAGKRNVKELMDGIKFVLQSPNKLKTTMDLVWELHRKTYVLLKAAADLGRSPQGTQEKLVQQLRELNQQLQEKLLKARPYCHPVLRRIVIASVVLKVLRYTKDEPWGPELKSAVKDVLLLLFHVHRRGAAAKSAVEFFHVSKSGGSTMCDLSVLNGCNATDTRLYVNCLMRRFSDGPRWVNHEEHAKYLPLPYGAEDPTHMRWFYKYKIPRRDRPCNVRRMGLLLTNITFVSNEHSAFGGGNGTRGLHVCRDTLNVIMLREPLVRVKSHVKWIMYVYKHVYKDKWQLFFLNRTADWWYTFTPAVVDNYYVRLLAGERAFYLPRGALTAEEHERAARLVVLQHDVVLQLEAPDINELHVKYGLGWRRAMNSLAMRKNRGGWLEVNAAMPPDEHMFKESTTLDASLYRFAVLLQHLDGWMYDVVRGAGLTPLPGFDSLNTSRGVRCGYIGHKDIEGAWQPALVQREQGQGIQRQQQQ